MESSDRLAPEQIEQRLEKCKRRTRERRAPIHPLNLLLDDCCLRVEVSANQRAASQAPQPQTVLTRRLFLSNRKTSALIR